ncbi:MAG: 2-amino-4-hydroxy-6-hydroxymethyldihydropteridine diphosphokinase [Planctomycetes bacterium]|nr:2-amino-4-hydroxy-6-hydroxymethyldihydropteridine diphosphokinase [Planctomycetota bacterium]
MKTYIGLGSNLGDRHANIEQASSELNSCDAITVEKLSDFLETPPLAAMDQPAYINAVAEISTTLQPVAFLKKLQTIEQKLGRTRDGKWQPRTIDLDILMYGDLVLETCDLTIPHRQMHLRSFVLIGMSQLAGDLIHPVLKRSMNELAQRLNSNSFALNPEIPQLICIAGIIGVGKTTLAQNLAQKLNCPILREAYDTNPYLPQVYAGKTELALKSQLYFLETRRNQLARENLSSQNIYLTDYIFDKDRIFAQRTINADQFGEYAMQYDKVSSQIASPILVIYLTDTPNAAMDRIHNRNRPYEQQMKLKTLQELKSAYDRLFAEWDKSPVITLHAGKFNCLDPANIDILAVEIERYICRQ